MCIDNYELSSGALCLDIGLDHYLLPYLVYVTFEGYGKTVWMHITKISFLAHIITAVCYLLNILIGPDKDNDSKIIFLSYPSI